MTCQAAFGPGRIAGHDIAMLGHFMSEARPLRCLSAKRTAVLGLPLLIYLAMSFLLFGRDGHWLTSYRGVGADPTCFIWFLHWWPFAIRHGLNPFVTTYIWFPHGYNLTWATSVPAASLIIAPVTALLGPLFSFNLLTMAAPALASWTAFLLCEDVTDDWLAALFGGYLYGFSAYEIGQLLGHLNLDFTCLLPLILLLCVRRVRTDIAGRTFITAVALCLIAEFGLSTEILATLSVFGTVTWAIFFVFAGKGERPMMLRMAIELAAAAIIMIILISPYLYFMAKGFGNVPGQMNNPQYFSTDPRNFFIPTSLIWLNAPYFIHISQQFTGNGSEQGAYLGLPLLILLVLFFFTQRHRRYVPPLLATTLILMVFCLGPHLQIGSLESQFPLPWQLTQDLPMINKALPSRFALYVSLSSAIAVALMLALAKRWLRWVSYGLVLAACVSLLPHPSRSLWTPWPAPPPLNAQTIPGVSGKLPNVLILPFGDQGPDMAWQVDTHMGFTQTGGYAGFYPLAESGNPVYANLANDYASAEVINQLKRLCASHGIDYILLAPGTAPAQAAAISGLGWPVRHFSGVTIVTVPPASQISYFTISGDYWDSAAARNWMGRKIIIATMAEPLHLTLLGQWTRPSSSLKMSVTDGAQTNVYPIAPDTIIPLDIPPHSTMVIVANETWVPDQRTDPRALSVMVEIGAP
jgi:hypothetical protein